jgi:hypothetical protein
MCYARVMPEAGSFRKLVRNLRKQEESLVVRIQHVRSMPVSMVIRPPRRVSERTYYYAGVDIGGTVYNVHISEQTFKKCLDAGVVRIHEEKK